MKLGIAIAIIGSLVAIVFAYMNVGIFLSGPNAADVNALLILVALAALLGAFPGLAIWCVAGLRRKDVK
jgi:hypothetical protein